MENLEQKIKTGQKTIPGLKEWIPLYPIFNFYRNGMKSPKYDGALGEFLGGVNLIYQTAWGLGTLATAYHLLFRGLGN